MPASAAPGGEAEDDAPADREPLDSRPERLDHPRPFVAKDGGKRVAPIAVGLTDVGVTDARRMEPYEHLAWAWVAELDRLDPLWLAEGAQDGGDRLDRH